MRFPAKKSKKPNIHLTALIDIVFLLLIFFLLSSSFIEEQGIKIEIPEVAIESKDLLPDVKVRIDQDGKLYYDDFEISEKSLLILLTERFQNSKKHKLAVHADRRVMYNRVVEVIDIAKQAGAKDFLLVNQQNTPP